MKRFKFLRRFLTKKTLIFGIPAVIVVFLLVFSAFRPKKNAFDFVAVTRGDIIQEISVTGTVKPADKVDLAFEKGGRVAAIYAVVGDRVSRGQIIARLNTAEQDANLAEAKASYEKELVKLNELKKGTRPEEIVIQETQVKSAEISLNEAKKSLADKIQDAYVKSDDAVRTKADAFFNNPRSVNPELSFMQSKSGLSSKIKDERAIIEGLLNDWDDLASAVDSRDDLSSDASFSKDSLSKIKTFLDDCAMALNGAFVTAGISQATIDGWKTSITSARTNISAAATGLLAAEEKFNGATIDLTLEKNQLLLERAGSTPDEIAAQEAQVRQVEANAQSLEAQIMKSEILTPIDGIISKKEIKAGEIVSAGTIAFSIISESKFQIEANITEADIAKVKIGDKARITLDAYGRDEIFEAAIVKIDPAETVIEGIPTYKTTFQFSVNDERIRSGMTANIDVSTDSRNDVLLIPQRTVSEKNGKKFVRVLLKRNQEKEVEVETGLKGFDGNIEIVSGLKEGDKVITAASKK